MSAALAYTDEVWDAITEQIGPLRLPRAYCPIEPHLKQEWFLRREEREVFFGGAAGPGKSWGLLMAALQYVDVGAYNGLLLRPTMTEFEQDGGLIDVSHDWLDDSDAYWNGTRREWSFPSGASIRFGYLANQKDIGRYKGVSYSFCGFDELTGFAERLYRTMFRVLRQALGTGLEHVPVRMRSASNPGDIGHEWVKTRFVDPKTRRDGAIYVPATIHDNPSMDYATYVETLAELDPVDRERLIRGDWDVTEEGGKFRRDAFQVIDAGDAPPARKMLRYWDLAGSVPSPEYPDPDYTVGLLYSLDEDDAFTIRHLIAGRWEDSDVERTVRATAVEDGRGVPVYVEQDPGQAGKAQLNNYKRRVLQGYACHAGQTKIAGRNAAKEARSRPAAAAVGNGLVRIVRSPFLSDFLDTVQMFPKPGYHDDYVDAFAGAHNTLTGRTRSGRSGTSSRPKGRIPGVDPRPSR